MEVLPVAGVEPVHDQLWVKNALDGAFAAVSAFDLDIPMDWVVEGWLPQKGASVWFGPGATGKTQLLLWMALALAATGDSAPSHWLGGKIQRRGQVLVLSAEDAFEHILMRLGSLARAMFPDDPVTARAACGRVHVMSFLSMSEQEFPQDAPTLFAKAPPTRAWQPHDRLKGIRYFIEEHNRHAEKIGQPHNKIVGVLMDSATSMAGFESTDSDGATNLFFYLNRMCLSLDIFWSVIGHTQKVPNVDPNRPRANSVARLRGSAMWSTAPRMVVEVRLACDTKAKSGFRESALVKRVRPEISARNILVVDIAKANVPVQNTEPRYLIRGAAAVLEDVTEEVVAAAAAAATTTNLPKMANGEIASAAEAEADREELRLIAVAEFIRQVVGEESDKKVIRSHLNDALGAHASAIKGLDQITPTRGSDDNPRPKSLNLYLNRLVERGALRRQGKTLFVADLSQAEVASPSVEGDAEVA